MTNRVLITGGAGFIGSHLVRAFLKRGDDVRVIDNFSSGKRANLAEVADGIELIEGDIRDLDACARACNGVQIVSHQAARPSVPLSVADPDLTHAVNVDGTFNLLDAARHAGVERFVYAASSSAYGEIDAPVKHEGLAPQPLSPYAVSKLAGEHYLAAFAHCYGLSTVSLRYFNVFGARQDPKSQYAAAIPAFATRLLAGRKPTVYGDGEQTRDFTYIDNVIHANLLAADAEGVRGEAVNVACGESVSVNEVIAAIGKYIGKPIDPEYTDPRPGDVRHSLADVSLAKKVIGYEPQVWFDEGMRLAVDWYRDNLEY